MPVLTQSAFNPALFRLSGSTIPAICATARKFILCPLRMRACWPYPVTALVCRYQGDCTSRMLYRCTSVVPSPLFSGR